jgi:hypothetical protein
MSGHSVSFMAVDNGDETILVEVKDVGGDRCCVSVSSREQILALERAGVVIQNTQLYECEGDETRKFAIGDRCELHGLEDYPELDGEIVFVTAFRDGGNAPDRLNPYYIRSESGNVERWLNYVWEKRLRLATS